MALFSGYGPGKKTRAPRKRKAGPDALEKKLGVSIKRQFKPFVSHQVTKAAAERHGLRRVNGGTAFDSERQVREYLAVERAKGYDVGWKDIDYSSHGVTPP